MLHALLLSSLIATTATPADTAALATKLAQAIVNEHGTANSKVYVGELPPGEHAAVPLPTGTLLGAVVQTMPDVEGFGGGTYTTLYYETQSNVKSVLDAYGQSLTKLGWHESAMQKAVARSLTPQGGFAVDTTLYSAVLKHSLYCNANGFIETSALSSPENVATVTYSTGPQSAAICKLTTAASALLGSPPPSPPPLPTLSAPTGVTMHSSFGLGDILTPTSRASITTTSSLATVGAAFARQLAAGGWQPHPAATSAMAYVQVFNKTVKGRHYQAVLSLITSGKPQRYDASVSERDLDRAPNAFPFP